MEEKPPKRETVFSKCLLLTSDNMKQLIKDGDEDFNNNNNQLIDTIVESRYKQLVEEGSYEVGVDPNINPDFPPVWFDELKFQRSQETAAKYHLSLKFASFSGLLLGIQVPLFLEPLLVTGNHETVAKLFKRYLDTDIKISSWYTSDPFDKSSDAYKSLRVVRGMHKSISKLMNESTDRRPGLDRLWVSQFQMAITQAGFISLLITHSINCGAHGMSDEELEDIIYLWRVLGYLNGVQDKYNLCNGGLKETQAYFTLINRKLVLPQISPIPNHPYPIGHQVAQGIADAFRSVQPVIRYHVYLTYWYDIIGIPLPPNLHLTWFHKTLLILMKLTFNFLLNFKFIYNRLNEKSKQQSALAKKNFLTIEEKLNHQYRDRSFKPGSCPYNITLDTLTSRVVDPNLIVDRSLDANHNQNIPKYSI